MNRLALLLACLCAPLLAMAQSGNVQLSAREVAREGSATVLSWTVSMERNVSAYEIRRRAPFTNGEFTVLGVMPAHGANRPYQFRDNSLFSNDNANQVDYLVVAIFTDGGRFDLFQVPVNYASTGLRRTWGSLKAMFQ